MFWLDPISFFGYVKTKDGIMVDPMVVWDLNRLTYSIEIKSILGLVLLVLNVGFLFYCNSFDKVDS